MSNTKVTVTITNRAPGIQPPVYVAGSFSKPEWVPEPMEYTTGEDGVHTFTKTLEVEPESKIVYKFRAGEGDWWLLNEDAPTVTDDSGNRNNLLEAPKAPLPEEHTSSNEPAVEPKTTKLEEQIDNPTEGAPKSHADYEVHQPKPVSHVEALQHSEQVDQARTSTPEFIKTITEVSESAALLDRSTPEPETSETNAGLEKKEEEHSSTTLESGAADTAAEVADTAALLDLPPPEPEEHYSVGNVAVKDKETPSEVAAEVADTAEKLDPEESVEAPSEVAAQVADTSEKLDSEQSVETPSEVAAQVADTAKKLDTNTFENLDSEQSVQASSEVEAPSEVAAQVADTSEKLDSEQSVETPSEVAAQVADTAEELDASESVEASPLAVAKVTDTVEAPGNNDEAETPTKTVAPPHKILADIQADIKDESLEIAGFSNESEPVPLFAHECAGLYENDEIPAATEEVHSSQSRDFFNDETADFDDPTLEKFPSTRNGIISTVRKVGSGLNVDQVSIEGAPQSPVAHARGSPIAEARSDPATSPRQTHRDLQQLPVPLSLGSSDERSLSVASVASLESIAEDAEGVEEEEAVVLQPQDIDDVAEQSHSINEATEKKELETGEKSNANDIAPVVEQAETAEEVIEAIHEVDGEPSKEVDSAGQDLPSVDDIPIENIAAIVELPSAAENSPSTVEISPAVQDIASVVEQTGGHDDEGRAEELDTKEAQNGTVTDPESKDNEVEKGDSTVEATKEINEAATLAAPQPDLEHLVTIPSPLVAPNTGLLSPTSDDDEAVVVKSDKGEDIKKSGYLTPERAATPQPEEPGSPREPAPNTADPVAESDHESDALETEPVTTRSVPPSPQIVLSKPSETQPDEELLPAAALGTSVEEAEPSVTKEVAQGESASREIGNAEGPAEGPAEVKPLDNTKDDKAIQETEDVDTTSGIAAPSPLADSEATTAPSQSANTATTSATQGNQTDGLKQRNIARPNPVDRSATPKSIPESHKEVVKGGNWFSSFLRLIFIDFVGGLFRKLTGGDRKKVVVVAVVLVAVGYVSLRRTVLEEQVV